MVEFLRSYRGICRGVYRTHPAPPPTHPPPAPLPQERSPHPSFGDSPKECGGRLRYPSPEPCGKVDVFSCAIQRCRANLPRGVVERRMLYFRFWPLPIVIALSRVVEVSRPHFARPPTRRPCFSIISQGKGRLGRIDLRQRNRRHWANHAPRGYAIIRLPC